MWSRSFCVQGGPARGNLETSHASKCRCTCKREKEREREREKGVNSGRQSEWSRHKAAILRFHLCFFSSVSSGPSAIGRVTRAFSPVPSSGSCSRVPCWNGSASFTLPSGRGTTVARRCDADFSSTRYPPLEYTHVRAFFSSVVALSIKSGAARNDLANFYGSRGLNCRLRIELYRQRWESGEKMELLKMVIVKGVKHPLLSKR